MWDFSSHLTNYNEIFGKKKKKKQISQNVAHK